MLARLRVSAARLFCSTPCRASNVGKQPIKLATGVECRTEGIPFEFTSSFTKGKTTIELNKQVIVSGPKGTLKFAVPQFVQIDQTDGLVRVSVEDSSDKVQRTMWGTSRALIQNHVIGASEGHLAIVKFVGTGYRATVEKREDGVYVALKIGYPYNPELKVPEGILVTLPAPTRLLIEGNDKQQVKLFAARIREFKKPEPYKGKGIYVDDEKVKLKEKKVK